MKTSWVKNEEDKKRFSENKVKNRKTEDVFKEPMAPPTLKPKNYISEEEMLELNNYIKTSGYFDNNKVSGLDLELIREFIRYNGHTLRIA